MTTRFRRTLTGFALAAWAAALDACAHNPGAFVWVDDLPAADHKAEPGAYVIGVGDVVSVRVWNQDAMTTRAKVRSDGRISLAFLNDVPAAGSTPSALAAQIQARLKDFFNNPLVTVSLEEQQKLAVSIVGLVAHAGSYQLDPGSGVLQALAAAGGLTDWADKDKIFVLRGSGAGQQRIRMKLESLLHAEGRAAQFRVATGDIIVAE
jgi:polysaccharide biosynthesis/export protein